MATRLPGRESRVAEAPLTTLASVVTEISDAIVQLTPLPLVVFGLCSGAIIALELAAELEAREIGPAHLVVAGQRAPRSASFTGLARRQTESEIVEILRDGGTPEALLEPGKYFDVLARALLADMRVLGDYQCKPDQTLHCPLTGVIGDADTKTSEADLAGWSRETRAGFRTVSLQGDHLFRGCWDMLGELVAELALANTC